MNKSVPIKDMSRADATREEGVDRQRLVELMQSVESAKPKRSGTRAWLWFIVSVVAPIVATSVYFWEYATPQYASSFRYVIQSDNTAQPSSNETGLRSVSSAESTELRVISFMLSDYISSPQMVADLQEKFDLASIFSQPNIDALSRLNEDASREQLNRYWTRRVRTDFDITTGLTSVSVTAFDPTSAAALAEEMVLLSESLVNSLSSRARKDTVRLAEETLGDAEQGVQTAQEALQNFRVSNLSVNPTAETGMTDGLLAILNQQYVEVTTQLSVLRSQLPDDSQLIVQLEQRARSLNEAIQAARSQVATSGAQGGLTREAFATQLKDFENLQLDLELATARYQSAVLAVDKAREQANRQQIYILTYVLPNVADTPNGQERLRVLFVVAVCAFAFWIITTLVVAAIRDNG